IGNVTRGPTTNDATAYSSNEVVNAIRKADTTAGRISGNVIERKVRRRLAPRSNAASSSETSIWSSRGTRTRIVYGRLITTCPITTVRIERGTPSWWKRRSSEIPKTTYGITSGLRRSAETAARTRKRRRVKAIEASTPRTTAPALESAAMIALVSKAPLRSELTRNSWYQCNVKPESGNEGTAESLNEKISKITIGAYRNATTRRKNTRSSRAPFFESATSISRPRPAEVGGSARRRR